MIKNNEITNLKLNKGIEFDFKKNYLHTIGKTSRNGNTYYLAFRLSNDIFIFFETGLGSRKNFINTIEIFSCKNRVINFLGKRNYKDLKYSEAVLEKEAISIILTQLIHLHNLCNKEFNLEKLKNSTQNSVLRTRQNQLLAYSDIMTRNPLYYL